MDTNEIMNNEVIETTEEIVKTSSWKALKVAGGIGSGSDCRALSPTSTFV